MKMIKMFFACVIVLFVFFRSPNGMRKTRASAWWLARTVRLYTHLEQQEYDTLQKLIGDGILEYVEDTSTAIMIAEAQLISWMQEVRLTPLRKLSAP